MLGIHRSPATLFGHRAAPRPGILATSSAPPSNIDNDEASKAGAVCLLHRQQPGRHGHRLGSLWGLAVCHHPGRPDPGDDTINFAVTGTITLSSALPNLATPPGHRHQGARGGKPDRGPQ